MNRQLLIFIRILNLGFDLSLIFMALINLIWANATNGSNHIAGRSFELLSVLSIIVTMIFFYFLLIRLINKVKGEKSSRGLIIFELGFVIIFLFGLIMTQIAMISFLFEFVIFIPLLLGIVLLTLLVIDSFIDLKKFVNTSQTKKKTANNAPSQSHSTEDSEYSSSESLSSGL